MHLRARCMLPAYRVLNAHTIQLRLSTHVVAAHATSRCLASVPPTTAPLPKHYPVKRSASVMVHAQMAGASLAAAAPDVAAARVVVATTSACPYCKRAKQALSEKGVAFAEVDVSADPQLRARFSEVAGRKTVPQIFLNGACLGGCDDLLALIASGQFDVQLAAASAPALPATLAAAARAAAAAADRTAQASTSSQASTDLVTAAEALAASGVRKQDVQFRWFGTTHADCISGSDLVTALAASRPDRAAALALAQRLLSHSLITVVSDTLPTDADLSVLDSSTKFYRLRADAPRSVAYGSPLNASFWWSGPARDAVMVSEDVRQRIVQLYDRHLSPDGRAVSYRGLKDDPAFWGSYLNAAAELQRVKLEGLSREQRMAFFINLYNALIVHAMATYGPRLSTAQRATIFSQGAAYIVGGQRYSADDMEHGVLRGNKAGAASLAALLGKPEWGRGPFGEGDPRLTQAIRPMDPRIHFALVCGAKSCPPIKMYTADTLEEGLAAAAEAFCAGEVAVDVAAGRVTLSKIFKWYGIDFGSNEAQRLAHVVRYLEGRQKADLVALLESGRPISVTYADYDWTPNSDE